MLAQFQSLYPNGNLISELVQIFQGKYIVRASVQIEGVTRATGMAAAETIEVAEDQARIRALMVLGITSSPQATVESSPKTASQQVQANPDLKTTVGLNNTYSAATERDFGSSQWSGVTSKEISIPPPSERDTKPDVVTNNTQINTLGDSYSQDFSPSFPGTSDRELEFDAPVENLDTISDDQLETPLFPSAVTSNVTPFTPRSFSSPESVTNLTTTGKRKKKAEPVNLSDILAKTDVQIERLGWTKEQGKEHLKKTYGKLGRSLLTEEELLDFLRYLESQPDPVAGF